MAELRLSRAEARGDDFPALCMQCGQPATDFKQQKFSTDQADIPPPPEPEPIGCLILWPIFGLVKLLSWATAKTMVVRTPLCHKHAHGWFNWSALEAKAIIDEEIIFKNVSEEFIAAWNGRPAAPSNSKLPKNLRTVGMIENRAWFIVDSVSICRQSVRASVAMSSKGWSSRIPNCRTSSGIRIMKNNDDRYGSTRNARMIWLTTVALFLCFAAVEPAHAARLLTATVELDGQVVLQTNYSDDSNPHRERVWRYLGNEPG